MSNVVINKFFKHASIERLLKLWSFMTVAAVTAVALIALYSNQIFIDGQQQLDENAWPLEHQTRHLSQLTTKFIAKQHHILHGTTGGQGEHQLSAINGNLQQEFDAVLANLSIALGDTGKRTEILAEIEKSYAQFLKFDNELMGLIDQQNKQIELINKQANKIKLVYKTVHEELLGLLAKTEQNHLNRFDDDISVSNSQNLHNILYMLQNAKVNLMLHYQYIQQEVDAENLDKSLGNELRQSSQQLNKALRLFEVTARTFPELVADAKQLTTDIRSLQQLIYAGENSSYVLKQTLLENQSALSAAQQKGTESALTLTHDVEKLSNVIDEKNHERIDELSEKLDTNYWLIIIIGVMVTLAVIIFVLPASERINRPLQELRRAMHALSQKRFHTRMKEREGKSEFVVLAKDFNVFAETTQQLISDLAEAKVSLESNQQRLLAVLNGVPEAILALSTQGVITASNPAADNVLNASTNELLGKKIMQFFANAPVEFEQFKEIFDQQDEFEGIDLNGDNFSLQASLAPVSGDDDGAWVCVLSDVSALRQAELSLKAKTSELDAIFENAMVGIAYIKDRNFLRVNHKFEELFGCKRAQIEQQSTRVIYHNAEAYENFGEIAYSMLEDDESFQADIQLNKLNGDKFWCSITAKTIATGEPSSGSIWLFEDITMQRENEQRLRRLASFDSLTGLPNRTVFNDRLDHAIAKANRNSNSLAIFFLDLDNFKNINDSLGHKTGDLLLCEVANRLKHAVREEDTVARLGGDEFTVILEDIGSARFVGKVAEKVLHSIAQPYLLEKLEVNISPSIGISLYPSDGQTLDQLVKNADAAMYHAKKAGRNNFQFYSADMNAQANQRLEMETALRKATETDEFYLHFQPQIDLESGQIIGAEALLRWNNDTFGNVSPAVFVPILEETGLISQVGEYVLRKACLAYMRIRNEVSEDFVVAVNLSGRQFKGGQLANTVKNLLDELGMPARNLELEITESMLMEDTQLAITTLRELSELGIMLAVDDFGTGYSSLAYLKQFPLNVLKIDRSFVSDVTVDDDDAAIVDAILAISRRLKLDVVAEGIETVEHLAFLQTHGCQRGQGFHFSKPLELDRLIDFLHQTSVELS